MKITSQEISSHSQKVDLGNNEPRNVLFFSQTNQLFLPIEQLRPMGWNPIQYTQSNKPEGKIDRCLIGMVQIERFEPKFVEQIKTILQNHSTILWLALINKESLADIQIKDLIRRSFYDFHTLPLDYSRLNIILGHAYGVARLLNEPMPHRSMQSVDEDGIVGVSPQIIQLRNLIKKAAMVNSPVLVIGESGTGKELVASSIHANSRQRNQPFVAVNCASLPSTLIQSELFGHEKGAFTGAYAKHIGRIESARGGSLFLDEIGDLSPGLQVNLLRFLQEKTISRLGGHEEIKVDARVIAATNVDLDNAIDTGTFRKDLYYRLNVIRINVPPLRERPDDVEVLANYFLEKFRSIQHKKIRGYSSEALRLMNQYAWPGNIREMINRIQRALVVSEGKFISSADIGLDTGIVNEEIAKLDAVRDKAEEKAIMAMMVYTKMNMSEAARLLGVTRATLYRLITKHKILLSRQKSEKNFLAGNSGDPS